jgi:hypothetical protein
MGEVAVNFSENFALGAINWPEDVLTDALPEYNPHELNLREMDETARLSAKKDELYEIISMINEISRPTKQLQELRTKLMARWDSYNE